MPHHICNTINSDQLCKTQSSTLEVHRVLTIEEPFVNNRRFVDILVGRKVFDESKSARSEVYCARRGGDSDHRSGCLAVRAKTKEYDCRPTAKVWARVRASGAEAWIRTKSRSKTSGSPGAG